MTGATSTSKPGGTSPSQIRVYTLIWEGEVPPGFEVLVAPVKAFFNHRRNEKLS
ncbi:hypothetical protein QCD79_34270, partial [Pseudomonas quasicaspiana]|nr:hypothetical protein [Pseudomonas quasicaspiana]